MNTIQQVSARVSGLFRKAPARSAASAKELGAFTAVALAITASSPAMAQISQVNTVMSNVQTVLTGVSATIVTCAIMWAGFKMMWQHAKWSEISNIVIGSILVGGAAGIAAWLL